MGRGRAAAAVLAFALFGAAVGYVLASAYLAFSRSGLGAEIDFLLLAREYSSLSDYAPDEFMMVNLIVGGSALAAVLLSAVLTNEALTKFGTTRWQTSRDMKRNGFFGEPGTGFLLGKLGRPSGTGRFLSSKVYPHALIVAPTGRGKTSGFVVPNLLTFKGSAVVLDVKGECFEATARHRQAEGDEVYRFAPTDWKDRRSHRYNPLLRIAALKDPDQRQMELQVLGSLFLQTENEKLSGLLDGGIDLFVAAGLLAFERDKPTLGEIYRITASGGDKRKWYLRCAAEVRNEAARLIFVRMSSTNNDTLTSYLSLLMTSGLKQWANPAIDRATATSDFDFRTIRKKPFSVYLVVEPLMVEPLAPLIRLFFSDLLASLTANMPGADERWPVMIMLDEFNSLGKMPIVLKSIETLRSYRGHLAVITQTIPALDEIYGENARRRLQGNAGVKLYLTPSDDKTIEELSKAVGKTTKRVVTLSRAIGRSPFAGRSVSERTEETPLLTEDEARRLDLDDIVMVIDAQMPARAKRIKYYEDRSLKTIAGRQKGDLPYPPARLLDDRVEVLEKELRDRSAAAPRFTPSTPELAEEVVAKKARANVAAVIEPEPLAIAVERIRDAAEDDPNAGVILRDAIAALAGLIADAAPTNVAPATARDTSKSETTSDDRDASAALPPALAPARPAKPVTFIPTRKKRQRDASREPMSSTIDSQKMTKALTANPEQVEVVRRASVTVSELIAGAAEEASGSRKKVLSATAAE